jgi:hypothetical protein
VFRNYRGITQKNFYIFQNSLRNDVIAMPTEFSPSKESVSKLGRVAVRFWYPSPWQGTKNRQTLAGFGVISLRQNFV